MVPGLGRFALIFLFLPSLIACGKGGSLTGPGPDVPEIAAPQARVEPLPANRIFGYYAYGEADAGCGWTNWILVTVNSQSVELAREKAEAAKACHIQVTYAPSGPWKHWPDTFRPIAQVFADAGVLHSVYVADEPMATGTVGYDELAQRIADVHAAGWPAFFTEELSGVDKPHPAVDYYGLDGYYLTGGNRPHPILDEKLSAHPEVNVYVAYSFFNSTEGSPAERKKCGFAYEMPDQREQIALARRHGLGVAFFTWITFANRACIYTGAGDDPDAQAIHRSLFRS